MPVKCKKCQGLIFESIDSELDSKSRHMMDQHLEHCPKCLEIYRNTMKWLAFGKDWHDRIEKTEPPYGMNDRIMAAIRQDKNKKTFYRSHLINRVAGVAFALIMIIAVSQMFFHKTAAPSSDSQMAGNKRFSNDKGVTEAHSSVTPTGADMIELDSGWTVFKGPVSEITYAASSETAGKDACDGFPDFQGLLDKSSDLYIFVHSGQKTYSEDQNTAWSILILAEYPSFSIEQTVESLELSLSTCENPVRIEIIKEENLSDVIIEDKDGMLPDLSELKKEDASWILILIGAY